MLGKDKVFLLSVVTIVSVVIVTVIFYYCFKLQNSHFYIEKINDDLLVGKDGVLILKITGVPSQYELDGNFQMIQNGDSLSGEIGWNNVDLGRFDDHISINVGEKNYWILGAQFRNENGAIITEVKYNE